MKDKKFPTLTLPFDDGDVECSVLNIFKVDGKDYIALLPQGGKGEDDDEVYILSYSEKENGEAVIDNIEDDDEYEAAADAFDEWLDSMEFDELDDEE